MNKTTSMKREGSTGSKEKVNTKRKGRREDQDKGWRGGTGNCGEKHTQEYEEGRESEVRRYGKRMRDIKGTMDRDMVGE